jgi:hypothetical protein
VATVQLRFDGWVTELADAKAMHNVNADLSDGRAPVCLSPARLSLPLALWVHKKHCMRRCQAQQSERVGERVRRAWTTLSTAPTQSRERVKEREGERQREQGILDLFLISDAEREGERVRKRGGRAREREREQGIDNLLYSADAEFSCFADLVRVPSHPSHVPSE